MFKLYKRRRPIWRPSIFSRVKISFKQGVRRLTFTRVAVIVLVLPLLFYVCREVFFNHPLIIDPFSVPKSFEDAGLTPDVIANKVGDALHEIEAEAKTRLRKDNPKLLKEEASVPNIELPGTKLGLKEVIEVTRSILNIYPSHVSGDIVADGSEKSGDAKKLKVTIYLTQNGNRGLAATISGTSDNVDGMAKDVAKAALRLINPYILATYEYGQNQFEDASGVLEEMIRSGCGKDREHAVAALNLRGLILLSQTKFATAENTFKQANDCKKTSIAYTNLGTAQLLQQNYEGAIASYRQAVYLDPKNADTHNALAAGLTLGGNNHFDEAVTEYEKAIELDGNKSLFYNDLGTAFAKHRDYEKAFADFQRATDLNPNDASIYENWGLALYQAGRYGEAAEKYEKIIELDTHNSTAYQDLGLSLLQLKKFNDAASRFAQAANLDPKNPAIYKAWSNALEGEGRKVEAKQKRAIAQRLIEKKPT